MMPTLPSSFTYCRPCSFARACTGSIGNAVLVGLDVGVAEQRVVVDRDLRVERDDRAVVELHERVHLDEGRVALLQQLVQAPQHVGRSLARVDRQRADELAHVERPQPEHRVDVHPAQRLGTGASELLDVHAALGGHHREVVAGRAVEQHRRVELPGDRQQLLDEHLGHLVALEVRPEHAGGFLGGPFGRVDEHDAPALAATADLHLHLHDAPAAELTGGVRGLLRRLGDDPARRHDAVSAEELLALVFVQIHVAPGESSSLDWTSCAVGSSRCSRSHVAMSPVFAPGVKISATPASFSEGMSSDGDHAASEHDDVVGTPLPQLRHDLREQRHVRAGVARQPHRVGVLLDRGLRDLLRRLVQPRVDHLEAGVTQGARDDLGPAVVAVEPRLRHHDAICAGHPGESSDGDDRAACGAGARRRSIERTTPAEDSLRDDARRRAHRLSGRGRRADGPCLRAVRLQQHRGELGAPPVRIVSSAAWPSTHG